MRITLLTLLLMGFSGAAWAGDFELGIEGGVMEADAQHTGAAWGLRAGVPIGPSLTLQARYLSMSVDGADSLREFGGQARVNVLPFSLTPYAFVGIAKRWLGEEGAWFVPFGGGVDLPVAPFVRLAPEFTWHHLVSDPIADPMFARDGWNASVVLRLDL